jgi:penicillin-insensitive murein endopeptidase
MLALTSCGGGLSGGTAQGQDDSETSPETRNDTSRAIGFYADGSLKGGFLLPLESSAHVKIFRERNRAWGTLTLVNTIIGAIKSFHAKFPAGERVQIGDLAAEHGGQISSVHLSHQNGLDADIAYLQADHIERNPNGLGPNGFGESFVREGEVTSNFDLKRNWFLLKEIIARGNVTRIFVDPAIKSAFCDQSTRIDPKATSAIRTETLRRIRPYDDHADHFHMRIACPKNSPKCLSQDEPPAGAGCDDVQSVSTREHDLLD